MAAAQPSIQQRHQPGRLMGEDTRAGTHYAETHERLEEFVGYFVKEAEAKFQSYHLILEGELAKSGKFSDTFSGIIGQGVGGAVGGIVGLIFGAPTTGASLLGKAGKSAGKKLGSKLGSAKHADEVSKLSDLVYHSKKNKSNFRKILVEAAFDIFQSFEIQFMRVSVDEMPKKAMRSLARDAVNRAINYLKNTKHAFISEGVIFGLSKKQLLSYKSTGFQIKYEYKTSHATWNTANLYCKVGLLEIQNGKTYFYKNSTSNTGKYGYRRVFCWESWDRVREKYDFDDIVESESGQFTDYQYVLNLKDMEVKCKDVLEKINLDDQCLEEERIKEVLLEVKSDIIEEVNVLKQESFRYETDRQIIENLEANIKNLMIEDHLKRFKQYFEEAKKERQDMAKSVEEAFQHACHQRHKIADDSKKQHENTQAGVEKINEKIEQVQKGQETSKGILEQTETTVRRVEKNQSEIKRNFKETGDNIKQINVVVQTLLTKQQSKGKDRIWFDVRESVKSFTGRQEQLDQLALYKQQGLVVVTGLRGVGKTELAIKHARTHYSRDSSVIWINAETRETTKQSFHRLYQKLGFKIKDNDGAEKDMKSIAEDVYDYFSERKSLFIFDNAEKYATIKDLLPTGLPTNANKPDVLITTNNLELGGANTLLLGDFSLKESTDFIKKFLNENDESRNSAIEELAKRLHNFPLALQQAVSYITEVNKQIKNVDPENNFTISNYLEEYERKTEDLLRYKVYQNIGSDYDKTTFTAVQITLSRIRDQEHGQQALEILNMMSYFAPDNIPAKIFLEFVNGNERQLGSIIQLIKGYSIVRYKGLLNMHGMVQQVIRLGLEKQKEEGNSVEENILNKILKTLVKYMVDYRKTRDYVPHIVSVWCHARKHNALIQTFIVSDIHDKEAYASYFHIIAEGSPYEIVADILNKIEQNYPGELVKVIKRESNAKVAPLHCAAMSGDEQIVKLLIDKGANVNDQAKHKWSPLHFAAKNGCLGCVNTLLDKGACIDGETEYRFTSLHLATKGGHKGIVEILLTKGANVNAETSRRYTPLHLAVDNDHEEIVSILLDSGAAVNHKTGHGKSSLHLAAKGGHIGIFNALIARGADIEAQTLLNYKPLHMAAHNGHLKIVQQLLSRGANVSARDGHRFTPLHLAAFNGHTDVVNALLHQNADANITTTKGNTPLHLAAERGHLEIVKDLVMKKANVDVKNQEGKTALDLATKGNFLEIKDYIIQHRQNRVKGCETEPS